MRFIYTFWSSLSFTNSVLEWRLQLNPNFESVLNYYYFHAILQLFLYDLLPKTKGTFCSYLLWSIVCSYIKVTKVNSKMLLMKSSKKDFVFLPAFYLVMCLMKAPKNFWEIVIVKAQELVYFWGLKTRFGKLLIEWCIFRHNAIWL